MLNHKASTSRPLSIALKFLCFGIVTTCTHGLLCAQVIPPPKVIPPSPNASALGKFTESPTGLYSGIPSVNIPIWSVEEGNLKIPISLSYHAGGVKVAEVASNVGLGWSLQCGGSITRTVLGLMDESMRGYLNNSAIAEEPGYDEMVNYAENGSDGQPDMFYCNMNGRSFRFLFDENGEIVTIPRQNVVIHKGPIVLMMINSTPVYAFNRWEVIDERGVTYKFSAIEQSSSYSLRQNFSTSSPNPAVNTWLLTEIISPAGDTVSFQYEVESYVSDLLTRGDLYLPREGSHGTCGQYVNSGPTALRQDFNNQRLTSITFSGGKVRFIPAAAKRADLINATALGKIIIQNKAGQVEREFRLEHGYLIKRDIIPYGQVLPGPTERNQLTSYYDNYPESFKRRLMLTGLREKDKNGVDLHRGYSFDYFRELGLPNRAYPLMDHWGFSNGPERSNPSLSYAVYQGSFTWLDKTPNYGYAKEGTLNKITYPTGGYATYAFQLNRLPAAPFDAPPSLQFVAGPSLSITHYHAVRGQVESDGSVEDRSDSRGVMRKHYNNFSVNGPEGHVDTNAIIENVPHFSAGWLITYTIKKVLSVSPLVEQTIWTSSNNGKFPMRLANGDYRLYHNPSWTAWSNPNDPSHMALYNVRLEGWYEMIDPPPVGPTGTNVGGLRLAEFRLYPMEGNDPLIYKYNYALDGVPTGRLISTFKYTWQHQIIGILASDAPNTTYPFKCAFDVLSMEPGTPLGTTQGSYVGYSHVEEQQLDKNNVPLGKTEYSYTFSPDGVTGANFPFLPHDNRDWMRGHPLTVSAYSYISETNGYDLVRRETNQYDFRELVRVSLGRKYAISTRQVGNGNEHDIAGRSYGISSGYFLKSSTEVIERGNYNTRTDYTYNPESLQLVRTTRQVSDGSKEHTFLTYPLEYKAGTAFIDALRAANIVDAEIERVVVQENTDGSQVIVGGTWKKYDAAGNPTELHNLDIQTPQPKNLFKFSSRIPGVLPTEGDRESFAADPLYKKRMTFDLYDGSRLLQYTLNAQASGNGEQSTAYLWGYHKMYPVAEVRNATYETISTVLGGNVSFGSGNLSATQQSTLRSSTALRSAQIFTYAYTPFVGMTSSTDQNNLSIIYEYDSFGRLTAVRDHQGDLIQAFRYNYARPGETGVDRNFVASSTISVRGLKTTEGLSGKSVDEVARVKQFSDGLGRLVQSVAEKGSPDRRDVVQPISYDAYGRESIQYLPYVSLGSEGWFKSDATTMNGQYTGSAHYKFYNGSEVAVSQNTMPYTQRAFDTSPLQRIMKYGAPGESWQPSTDTMPDHAVQRKYMSNLTNEVLLFSYDAASGEINCYRNGTFTYYQPGSLQVDVIHDEHNVESREYKDRDGRIILKRVQYDTANNTPVFAETYYVYDTMGNLVAVLSPEATRTLKTSHH